MLLVSARLFDRDSSHGFARYMVFTGSASSFDITLTAHCLKVVEALNMGMFREHWPLLSININESITYIVN